MKNIYFSRRVNGLSRLTLSFMLATTLSLSYMSISFAETNPEKLLNGEQTSSVNSQAVKDDLIAKLSKIQYINAQFSQVVMNDLGEVLQEGKGTIAISKPDLVNWHTTEPDETLIVSNGKSLWFYDPFIDQVSVYSFSKSIANTPVLLLTSEDPTLWDAFEVSQIQGEQYLIKSLNTESQIKSLALIFKDEQLSQLTIVDSTGQLSHISLLNVDFTTKPDSSLFDFVVPEGVMLDDQR